MSYVEKRYASIFWRVLAAKIHRSVELLNDDYHLLIQIVQLPFSFDQLFHPHTKFGSIKIGSGLLIVIGRLPRDSNIVSNAPTIIQSQAIS